MGLLDLPVLLIADWLVKGGGANICERPTAEAGLCCRTRLAGP